MKIKNMTTTHYAFFQPRLFYLFSQKQYSFTLLKTLNALVSHSYFEAYFFFLNICTNQI